VREIEWTIALRDELLEERNLPFEDINSRGIRIRNRNRARGPLDALEG